MSIHLRYLGTADRFEDSGNVYERDGDPVETEDDRAELLQSLPGESFEEVDGDELDEILERQHAEVEAEQARAEAEAEVRAEHDKQAEADAARRDSYYNATTAEEAFDALSESPPAEGDEGAEASTYGLPNPSPLRQPEPDEFSEPDEVDEDDEFSDPDEGDEE